LYVFGGFCLFRRNFWGLCIAFMVFAILGLLRLLNCCCCGKSFSFHHALQLCLSISSGLP
jgi:hypothetical protein